MWLTLPFFSFLSYTCDVEKGNALLLLVHGMDLILRPSSRMDAHLIAVILWVLALDHRGRRTCIYLRGYLPWSCPNSERLSLPMLEVLTPKRSYSLVYQCGLRATPHSNLPLYNHDETQYELLTVVITNHAITLFWQNRNENYHGDISEITPHCLMKMPLYTLGRHSEFHLLLALHTSVTICTHFNLVSKLRVVDYSNRPIFPTIYWRRFYSICVANGLHIYE